MEIFLGLNWLIPSMVFSSSNKNVVDSLVEIGKLGCKPVKTPIELNHKLGESIEDVDMDRLYQRLVKKAIYLSRTRLDITYAVGVVSQLMHNPKETHLRAVYHIL